MASDSETLNRPSPEEISLPSTEDVIGLVYGLRDRIEKDSSRTHHIHVLGHGDGLALNVAFPGGGVREIGWIPKGGEAGILAWVDKGRRFEMSDDYNLIYVNRSIPAVGITGIRESKSYPSAKQRVILVDWDALRDLFSLAQQLEEA
jgi:hypothetical protein